MDYENGITLRQIVDTGLDITKAWSDGVPLLLVKASSEDAEAPTAFRTPPEGSPVDTTEVKLGSIQPTGYLAPNAVVLPLVKTKRNPFTDTITIGRARVNDVIIQDNHVSKVHCWFLPGKPWMLHDNNATNGTFLNDRRLAKGETVPIHASDEIRVGGVTAVLIDPPMFGELLAYACRMWERYNLEPLAPDEQTDVTQFDGPPTP